MAKAKEGDNGLEIEGKVAYAQAPKTMNFGDEEVIKQFIVIKDDTGEQGCNATLKSRKDKICKATYIKFRGTVSKEYKDKKGEFKRSLNGYKVDETVKAENFREEENVSQEKPKQSPTNTQPINQPTEKTYPGEKITRKEYTKDDYWRDKALRDIENNKCIVRECAIKAATEIASRGGSLITSEEDYYKWADNVVDYIYNGCNGNNEKITSKAITKEFGGTAVEEKTKERLGNLGNNVVTFKEQKIAQAKELVRNPHLTEPVNDKMASVKQKKQIYGYIDEEGKKIGGMVDSRYIKEGEVKNIGEWQDLTKAQAIRYWNYWYGKEEEVGERDKRELEAKEKEGNPFVTKEQPLEKKDPKSNLTKDVLIDDIQAKRKELFLEDDAKFKKEMGYNTDFEAWTEKDLTKLKNLLKDWKPSWITEK